MVYLAADHRGFEIKEKIESYLKEKAIESKDIGPYEYNKEDDYPDFAFLLGDSVIKGKEGTKGILICGTGIGMSIAVNKVKGIRAAKTDNVEEARMSREHEDANVLILGYTTCYHHDLDYVKQIVDVFLNTEFTKEERHIRRLRKIEEYENGNPNT